MRRLYLSPAAVKASESAGAALLVGQRCPASASPPAAPSTVDAVVVAECVPCDDASVVNEQLECLERVLPFGIEVVGVSGSAGEVADLAARLHAVKSRGWVAVVRAAGPGERRACHVLGTPAMTLEVAEAAAEFIEVRFALHSCEQRLPLVLTPARGGAPVLLDAESSTTLLEAAPSIDSGAQCVQLGASPATLRIHVVLAPAFTTAKGICEVLQRQISAAVAAGTTRLVEVRSHNTHISYCCRVEPAGAAQDRQLSAHALEEVLELIEDATGAAPQRGDVEGATSSAPLPSAAHHATVGGPAPPSPSHGASTPKQKADRAALMLLVGVTVFVLVVALATMR